MWEGTLPTDGIGPVVEWFAGITRAMARGPGYVEGRAYTSADSPPRAVVVTTWRDEELLESSAGPGWRTEAATAVDPPPGLVSGPARVWHFVPVPVEQE